MNNFYPQNLIIITGPSGVGKTSVALALIKKHLGIKRLVTYTTRKKRSGEKDGIDYHFVSAEQFKKMIDNNELFEWAEVYGNYYGNKLTDLEDLSKNNKFVLMVLDIVGAKTIKEKFKNSIAIFLFASPKDLLMRLRKRGKIRSQDLSFRKNKAEEELKTKKYFDYEVYNRQGELEETLGRIEEILEKVK